MVHGDIQRHPDFGKLCNRLAEETLLYAAPAIDCCCRTLVRSVCAESVLFGVYGKPGRLRRAGELSALGKRGDTIARAREQVIDILQHANACSAWFEEADPDATEIFRSLHFELEVGGTSYVYSVRDSARGQLFKHPWAARTTENGGRNSVIQLNGNGPFFNRTSRIMQLDPGGTFAWPAGNLRLTISSYNADTPEAQITILLHELGHIIGRLPEDDASWDGRSSRNTSEVSRHCKSEIRVAAHNSSRGSIRAHNSGV